MQVTNHSNNIRKMKEELLEAIYGTVERLEQKVDELSSSPKNTEAGNTPVSVRTDIVSRVRRLAETIALANRMRD